MWQSLTPEKWLFHIWLTESLIRSHNCRQSTNLECLQHQLWRHLATLMLSGLSVNGLEAQLSLPFTGLLLCFTYVFICHFLLVGVWTSGDMTPVFPVTLLWDEDWQTQAFSFPILNTTIKTSPASNSTSLHTSSSPFYSPASGVKEK